MTSQEIQAALNTPEAEQTPEQRAYFDGYFNGTQDVRAMILAAVRAEKPNAMPFEITTPGMDAVERLIVRLRDKRRNDALASLPAGPSPRTQADGGGE